MEPLIAIAVVDDEEILLDQVGHWLQPASDRVRIASTAQTLDEFIEQPRLADIVLLDLLLRDGRTPSENIRRLVAAGFTVVAISSRDNPARIREAIAAGAHSYVRKARDPEELLAAIEAAATGAVYTSQVHAAAVESATATGAAALSIQEREALRLYASGMTIAQAAERMHIEASTLKGYLDRARRKYESSGRAAHTKIDLRQRAVEDGILPATVSDE